MLALFPVRSSRAQSGLEGWSQPVNVSKSGAASQPRIVASTNGELQIFWWDNFDGLMTASYDGNQWTNPELAPIQSQSLNGTPYIIADQSGWVHAFWSETGKTQTLMHSQMPIGSSQWSLPQTVASDAVFYDASEGPGGGLALAYTRTENTSDAPAGIYVRYNRGGGSEWETSTPVYTSIYFRLLTGDQISLQVSDGGNGRLYLVWEDPRKQAVFYSKSIDYGLTWSSPESLADPEDRPVHPRVVALPNGEALRQWQASNEGACTLYQQHLIAVSLQDESGRWTDPGTIFDNVRDCPQNDRFWVQDQEIFWIWGDGQNTLSLAAWDQDQLRWSEPTSLVFAFIDPGTQNAIQLADLQAIHSNNRLAVAGTDSTSGEVWVTIAKVDTLELAYAKPSPWSKPVFLTQSNQLVGKPTIAMDSTGQAHIVWSQKSTNTNAVTSLIYARWSDDNTTNPVTIMTSASDEIARQPDVIVDDRNALHLVWSGGLDGSIQYSFASIEESDSSSGWATPKTLSRGGIASWPQIRADAAGNLYVVYSISYNEGRGIYLVRSEDRGESWSSPQLIFDAVAAGWQVVDKPSLAMTPDGILHLAWVQGALPDTWAPKGLLYTRSDDQGESWTSPLTIAGPGFDWPYLAITEGNLHLLFANSQRGGIWHRWVPLDTPTEVSNNWSTASQVPGWQNVSAPFGVAVDGTASSGTLHLVGVDAGIQRPLYSRWQTDRWSSVEAFSPAAQAESALGAAASTRPQGGTLAIAWLAPANFGDIENPRLEVIARTIPIVNIDELPNPLAPAQTPTLTPSPSPEPTPEPTATPNLASTPLPSDGGVPPLVLGGGLAALIVVSVFTGRLILGRR